MSIAQAYFQNTDPMPAFLEDVFYKTDVSPISGSGRFHSLEEGALGALRDGAVPDPTRPRRGTRCLKATDALSRELH